MAKWSRPPAASLIAFSSLSPFITHNFIKIPPHLSLPLSPLLLPSLSLSRLTTITVSLFSYEAPQDWTSFITSTLMYFFLLPPSLRPSVLGLLLSALLLRALLLFFMYFISFLVFFAPVAVARHPSLLQSLTLTRSFAQVQSHFGKILHMSKSSRVKPFVFHLREKEPKNVVNI